jgi:hypothetical protein
MSDNTGWKTTLELSGVSHWRRVLLALGNLGFFVVALLLAPWLARSIAGDGASWWIGFLIFLIPLVAVDLLLQVALLRPVQRGHAGPTAPTDRPRD